MELEPKDELISHHFSDEHPLELTINSPPKPNTTCFGCKQKIFPGNYFYKCKSCTFSLHQVCHNMPKVVEHPSDPNHPFALHSTPVSAKEVYNCKACGHHIPGFYYSCAKCEDYYHILCLIAPLSVKISSHIHSVKLEFSPPYDYECNLCNKTSFSGWVYHCGSCEFDAHVTCAIKHKGEEYWLEHESMPRDKSHELMACGMNGSNHLHTQDQSDSQTLSYQFSEALFSIDFAKSLLGDDYIEDCLKQAYEDPDFNNKLGHDSHDREPNQKNGRNLTFSKGIGSHIWSELGKEGQTVRFYGYRDGKYDAERRKSNTENLRSSCRSRIFLCLFCLRK